ncbi:hypothetical protein M569_00125 [Genlisea aurea]|uniref:Uncharacterized protein n=1 Tax=Genlisea aurea TaxID=192259 RepID=S8DAV4_9LAMI|nr:hypothetical protein M569_00125 [Genlisea aurea]
MDGGLQMVRLTHFLSGLNDNYNVTRNFVLAMTPLLETAFSMLFNVEPNFEKEASVTSSALLSQTAISGGTNDTTRYMDKKNRYSTKCKKMGHLKATV